MCEQERRAPYSCQTASKRPSEDLWYLGSRCVKRPKIYPPKDTACTQAVDNNFPARTEASAATAEADLTGKPLSWRPRLLPVPVPPPLYGNPVPDTDLFQGGRVSTGMLKIPPIREWEYENRHCSRSFAGMDNYSMDQPDHPPRLPSLSPISPKQECKNVPPPTLRKGATASGATSPAPPQATLPADGEDRTALDRVPATSPPKAPPAQKKPLTPTSCHLNHTMSQGVKSGGTPPESSSHDAQATAPSGLAQTHTVRPPYSYCSYPHTKPQVAYSPAAELPAITPPAHPNTRRPPHTLPPHLREPHYSYYQTHPQFAPMAPLHMPQRHVQGFSPMVAPMPLRGFNNERPPVATSLNHHWVKPNPAGPPEMPTASLSINSQTQTQNVQPGQDGVFRPPASLIQPTYRKTSPNLIVDVAETCQEKFPFLEVAERHRTSVDKVVDIFAAIIQTPLLRCPTDRRRAGKLATARIKEYTQAQKSLGDSVGNADAKTRANAVAEHLGPLDLPDHVTFHP